MAWQTALPTTYLDPQVGSETMLDADGLQLGPVEVNVGKIQALAIGGAGGDTTTIGVPTG